MLDVFYIGLDRFRDRTRENHAWMLDQLSSRFGQITTHDFLQPKFDRSDCPVGGTVGSAGGLQVWDFMKAVQKLSAPCVMKLRTDVWFAHSSLAPVARAVERCLSDAKDVVYLGANVKQGLDDPDDNRPADHHKKVPDFVVVARRSAVLDIDRVRAHLAAAGDVASGNRVFKIITPDLSRSETTWCRIFLVRRANTFARDWNIACDFVRSYPEANRAQDFLLKCRPEQPL
jgi:hypothetical protein